VLKIVKPNFVNKNVIINTFVKMKITFYKYQGTGNDFVLLDNTGGKKLTLDKDQINKICNRKFGVGSDGVILINESTNHDFSMMFHNPDGTQSFCGNGARCAVLFANKIGILKNSPCSFEAIDGVHKAYVCADEVKLEMSHIGDIQHIENDNGITALSNSYFIDTGSPHVVSYVEKESELEQIVDIGSKIRYLDVYREQGVNVNLVKTNHPNSISIATYERGVENETLSCGTGATACALIHAKHLNTEESIIEVQTKGGELKVSFERKEGEEFSNVHLIGPAKLIFNGEMEV